MNTCCYCNREIGPSSQACGICVRERNNLSASETTSETKSKPKTPSKPVVKPSLVIETKIQDGRKLERIRLGNMVSEWSEDASLRLTHAIHATHAQKPK